ncbi:MAG: nitroreductase [Desulfuromonadales bacterium C00003068]|jgi:nitroreductase|nr:MAG: nitroreductase [Desulfuromonadales bacterium C00003068]
MLKDLLQKNRSYRRFHQNEPIKEGQLRALVDLTRSCSAAANVQSLRYLLSFDPHRNERIFGYLGWAGYLKNWSGPQEGEKPAAYIVVLGDKTLSENFGADLGICAQTILLGAVEQGLGGCMIAAIQKQQFREQFKIPTRFEILMVIALGRPAEQVRLVDKAEDGDIKYWRDDEGVHFVPKRTLDHLVLNWLPTDND